MQKPFLSYIATLVTMVALDLLFWGILFSDFLDTHLGSLAFRTVDWSPIALFYVIYALGAFLFVVKPQAKNGAGNSFLGGALYGLVVMGCFALFNDAVNPAWSSSVTFLLFVEAAVVAGAATMAGISVGSSK